MRRKIVFIIVCLITSLLAFVLLFKLSLLFKNPEDNIHSVALLKDKAEPDIIAIKTGQFVQFNSADSKNHDLEQGEGNANGHKHEHTDSGLGSGNFTADEGYRIQFKKEGIYFFHDHYNPDLNITVVVKDRSK